MTGIEWTDLPESYWLDEAEKTAFLKTLI